VDEANTAAMRGLALMMATMLIVATTLAFGSALLS
jgi:hypothetical protein